jgi:integrase
VLLERGVELDDVLGHVFGDPCGSLSSFAAATAKYLEYARLRKRPSSIADDEYRLAAISRARWASKRLSEIRPADLLGWVEERRESREVKRLRKRRPGESLRAFRAASDRMEPKMLPGASAATVNKDLNLISALFRWAIRAGHVDENPARKVERLSEKGRARETYLTGAEARAFVEACPPALRPLVVTALNTGCRRGELLALAWRDVDMERREIVINPANEKAGRGRVIPMTSALHRLLEALCSRRPLPALDGSDRVFLGADGLPIGVGSLRGMWEQAIEAAGDGISASKRESLTFHCLRHTAASLMAAARIPLLDIARVLGHSTISVTMRYAHFAPESGRRAIDALGGALAGGTPEATKPVCQSPSESAAG